MPRCLSRSIGGSRMLRARIGVARRTDQPG
jgi:hypothetical protein